MLTIEKEKKKKKATTVMKGDEKMVKKKKAVSRRARSKVEFFNTGPPTSLTNIVGGSINEKVQEWIRDG